MVTFHETHEVSFSAVFERYNGLLIKTHKSVFLLSKLCTQNLNNKQGNHIIIYMIRISSNRFAYVKQHNTSNSNASSWHYWYAINWISINVLATLDQHNWIQLNPINWTPMNSLTSDTLHQHNLVNTDCGDVWRVLIYLRSNF